MNGKPSPEDANPTADVRAVPPGTGGIPRQEPVPWEYDSRRLCFRHMDPRIEQLLGYPASQWLQESHFWSRHIHPDDVGWVVPVIRSFVAANESHVLEFRMLHRDGRVVWIRNHSTTFTTPEGEPDFARGTFEDVSPERTQKELHAEEGRFAAAFLETSGALILILDPTGRAVRINRAFEEVTGYTLQDVRERHFCDFMLDPEAAAAIREWFKDPSTRPIMPSRQIPILARDGRKLTVVWNNSEIRGPDGKLRYLVSTGVDMTEREAAAAELRYAKSLLEATLESTADGILVVDMNGAVTSYNQKFVQMWRIPREIQERREDQEMLGFVLDQLSDPESFVGRVRELYSRPEAESFDVLEFKDERIFERYSQPQRIGSQCVGRVWSFRDVTGRARAEQALRLSEEQLRHSQKMEALGRLAGGISHDFNNLLTAILGYTDLLLESLEPGSWIAPRLAEIHKAAERAAALTSQLLAFSRKQMLSVSVMDLNAVLSGMQELLQRLLGENVALKVELDPLIGHIRADPGQVQQVVLNLVLNSRDAMPQGGIIVLSTSETQLAAGDLPSEPGLVPGRYVVFSVGDTGTGMDPDTVRRAFEPFFTTKPPGQGTGLGLAMVYGIVKQSGGTIVLYSEPGRQTLAQIYLPRVEAQEGFVGVPFPAPPVRGGAERTILVAEDDEMVRQFVQTVVERLGLRALIASSGPEALELSRRHPGVIDLLLTDVVMPGLSGPELAQLVRSERGRLPVLFMSGYAGDSIQDHAWVDEGASFISKPFTVESLGYHLQTLLAVSTSTHQG